MGGMGSQFPSLSSSIDVPNRDAQADAPVPYYRLHLGNLYYNLSAEDLRQVFEPFGELAFVDLPVEPGVRRTSVVAVDVRELILTFFLHTDRRRGTEATLSCNTPSLRPLKWLWPR